MEYIPGNRERLFIVSESALLQLFHRCSACPSIDVSSSIASIVGTMAVIHARCHTCDTEFRWSSQPRIAGIPEGNLLLSAGILFAGALPRKTLRVLNFMGLATISPSTYFIHQRKYLHSTIRRVWEDRSRHLLASLKGKQVILGGDGRSDGMGHSAKFGTYSLMDIEENKVLTVNTVQVNPTANFFLSVVGYLQTWLVFPLWSAINPSGPCPALSREF